MIRLITIFLGCYPGTRNTTSSPTTPPNSTGPEGQFERETLELNRWRYVLCKQFALRLPFPAFQKQRYSQPQPQYRHNPLCLLFTCEVSAGFPSPDRPHNSSLNSRAVEIATYGLLRVKHVPVISQDPPKCRELTVYHAPLKIIPRSKVLLSVTAFDTPRSFQSPF